MIGAMSTIGMIGVGGALGAIARHGVNVGTAQLFGHGFPYGTLIVNILGSFLMGVLIVKFSQINQVSQEIRMLTTTGFLGAFTTFSTFSLDAITLWERGEMLHALGYILISVICSILALAASFFLMRGVTS